MDFDLDDEQRELRDASRRFLEREAGIGYARAMCEDARGDREDLWKQMAGLGWTALPFAEEHDGLGLGSIALSILLSEMGRVVLPGPYTATILAGLAIADAGSAEQRARWLPGIAAGDTIACFAAEPGHVEERDGALYGARRFVHGGEHAALTVVVAHTGEGAGLFVAEPSARTPARTMDGTRRSAHLVFDGVPAERLGDSDESAVHRALQRGALATAAEMLGGAERVLEISNQYAKEREQFGKPIGSFQAVKHRLADMLVDVESLRNIVYYAAWAHERAHPDAALAMSMAKAFAADAGPRVAKSGIQVHGGVGFTWEHDMHLYFKRAKASEHAYGDAAFHREVVAGLLRARAH